ncbi:hypothetical protein BDP27DRAFT_1312534 [Rhodocollybia butyracea]|uniref:Signal recognition particle subunit SRP68 n=1 Tax=Rhodocollybia butyracea TaxID=206335 RepID=A0A9P5UF05_9AGAR|nr:hypothetical protein BDP27DRAFT_1312534 [Rhodocollybia butyracea]
MFDFRALQIANEQQSSYGLRYDDFARYRKHCANRTHRLRSSLKMNHSSPKGRDFKKLPPMTEMDLEKVKEGHLQLLLLESERAWAYAQELTALSLQPANSTNSTAIRHHATGRFRRSIHWATQLLSLSQSLYTSTPRKLGSEYFLEVTAYVLLLNGRFLMSREDHESALAQLCVTRYILDLLAENAGTSKDYALAVLWADQVGPMIRWCAHSLGQSKSYDVDRIVKETAKENINELVEGSDEILTSFHKEKEQISQSGGTGRKLDQTRLMWEGEPVPVRNPELVDVLLRVQAAETKLSGEGPKGKDNGGKKAVAAYDAILAALSDAEDIARKLSESEAQKASSSTIPTNLNPSGGQVRDMHFVHTYIVYQLLSKRIQRDLLLVAALVGEAEVDSSTAKAKVETDPRLHPAVVKLLESILQSLTQMRALSVVDDNADLSAAVDARISYTKARRCITLGRCYVVPGVKKYAEALTLLQHTALHVREARSLYDQLQVLDVGSDPTSTFYPLSKEDLDLLESANTREGLEYKRVWLEKGGAGDGAQKHKKPVFFNLALNYVDLDVDRLRERAGRAPPRTVPPSAANRANDPLPSAGAGAGLGRAKASVMEEARSGTPEPREPVESGKGGPSRLGSLLGGWWGRN